MSMTPDRTQAALAALMDYHQADMDGIMVLTSRQAIHEVHDACLSAIKERDRLREALEEADFCILGLARYADRAWAGEVDAGGRELRRQVDCKSADYWQLRAALSPNDKET